MTTLDQTRSQLGQSATTLSRTAAGYSASAAITLVFNAVLTIVKDASVPLHDFMQKLMGHHWTTHGVVILVVFLVLGWLLSRSEAVAKMSDTALIGAVVVGALINGGAIALWFLFF
jgi:hypothetical protein